MKDHLIIFDTTLRDGEQSPGASMTQDEKVRIALALFSISPPIIFFLVFFAYALSGPIGALRRRMKKPPVQAA